MRIRKNAKISALLYTNTNPSPENNQTHLQKNFCQLNQSPWDIITFPPSDSSSALSLHQFDGYEVYYNVNLSGNGSSIDSIGAFESVASKNSFECENDNVNVNDNVEDKDYGFCEKEEFGFKEGEEEIVLCGKTNGKGWQCGRMVKNGNTMGDHHVSKLQNDAVWATKKTPWPAPGRTKKPAAVAANPHEFYYYSGFGPLWGKKRGAVRRGQDNKDTTFNAHGTTTTSSGSVEAVSGNDDDMDVEKEGHKTTAKVSWSSGVESRQEELDFIDKNVEEEEEKVEIVGKKRGRKPIKARSLKSLM